MDLSNFNQKNVDNNNINLCNCFVSCHHFFMHMHPCNLTPMYSSYQLNENSTEFSFFGGVKVFTPFLKMVLPVAPPSIFRWVFDILNFLIHKVFTLFF
jgi:hypothetical protein